MVGDKERVGTDSFVRVCVCRGCEGRLPFTIAIRCNVRVAGIPCTTVRLMRPYWLLKSFPPQDATNRLSEQLVPITVPYHVRRVAQERNAELVRQTMERAAKVGINARNSNFNSK